MCASCHKPHTGNRPSSGKVVWHRCCPRFDRKSVEENVNTCNLAMRTETDEQSDLHKTESQSALCSRYLFEAPQVLQNTVLLEFPRSLHFRSFKLFGLFKNLSGFRSGLSVLYYYSNNGLALKFLHELYFHAPSWLLMNKNSPTFRSTALMFLFKIHLLRRHVYLNNS